MSDFLLKNYNGSTPIDWKYCSEEDYREIETILTNGVVFFEPFIVDDFLLKDDFEELLKIFNDKKLKDIDYSRQMNKWEEHITIPQKIIDYSVNKVKELIGCENIQYAYHMYAHHQITSDGRVPKLPLHIDWSPGAYMIDLQIGGNRDWDFVAGYKNFICKPNQAIICQPQFDFHYRPSWNNNNPDEYYQALFFHLVNKEHWSNLDNTYKTKNNKYAHNFGHNFRDSELFINFQNQRTYIFERDYIKNLGKLNIPMPPFNEIPSSEDSKSHSEKNVIPLAEKK